MSKRENESNRLRDILPKMLEENHLQKGMNQLRVAETWEEVMGPGVMNYTDWVKLSGQTLMVKLNSSALREELAYGNEKILKMMNESLKDLTIAKIKLV